MPFALRATFCLLVVLLAFGLLTSSLSAEKKQTPAPIDLKTWQGVGGSMKAWSVKDGVLHCDGAKGKGHARWIATKQTYDHFEISLEFNVAKDGNSGVFFRAPLEGNPARNGMEVQLFDNDSPKYSNKPPAVRTGAIWNIAAPKKDVHKKAGVWQTMRIRCVGRICQVWHNGVEVVHINLDDRKHQAKNMPGIISKGGHIGLQNHGTPFAFRNIQIKRIKPKTK